MYVTHPFKYCCFPRFYLHLWLPSSHSTITSSDLIQTQGFSFRICWWLWLRKVLLLVHTSISNCPGTSPLNFIEIENLICAKLNSPSSRPICVLLPILHILVNGDMATKLSKPVTRFFLYCSNSLSFYLQMATKTYLLISKVPPLFIQLVFLTLVFFLHTVLRVIFLR